MDEIFKALFDKAPDIIHEAAQSPLGLASLIVLVLGTLGFLLFRNAAGKLKLLALAMLAGNFLGLVGLVAFVYAFLAGKRRLFLNVRCCAPPRHKAARGPAAYGELTV